MEKNIAYIIQILKHITVFLIARINNGYIRGKNFYREHYTYKDCKNGKVI
jgi:hypothetical protein